jgi:type IX secretion system PorP/SprF family membrane protein
MRAQDIHFSQFYAAPLNLNPALTGAFNGNIRGILNYRNQWNSVAPFNTFAATVDWNFGSSFLKNDLMGIGLNAYNDIAGTTEFTSTVVSLSYAYIKRLGNQFNRSYLSAGFQGSYAQKSVNYLAMTFANQYDGVNYDPTLGSGESMPFDNRDYLDLSAGLVYYLVPREDRFSMYLGGSVFHVNEPDQSIGAAEDKLYMRMSGHFGFQKPVGKMTSLVGGYNGNFQGPYVEHLGGLNLKFYLDGMKYSSTAISFGIWQRIVGAVDETYHSDATIILARLDYEPFSLGFSYDVNISSLNEASHHAGGPEISLTYIAELPQKPRKIPCPKF